MKFLGLIVLSVFVCVGGWGGGTQRAVNLVFQHINEKWLLMHHF